MSMSESRSPQDATATHPCTPATPQANQVQAHEAVELVPQQYGKLPCLGDGEPLQAWVVDFQPPHPPLPPPECRPLIICDRGMPRVKPKHLQRLKDGEWTFNHFLANGLVEYLGESGKWWVDGGGGGKA